MFYALKNIYFRLNVLFLAIFKPVELFERINQLGWYKKTLHQWVDEYSLPVNSRVLEAGCATGALCAYLAYKGLTPTGVDFSQAMVSRAQKKYKNIAFFKADVLDMPFADNMFDAVLATSLVNIVDDKGKAIRELTRVCQHAGRISILVPNSQFGCEQFDVLWNQVGDAGFSSAVLKVWHKRAPKMSKQELIVLFSDAGLEHIRVQYYLNNMLVSVCAIKPVGLT